MLGIRAQVFFVTINVCIAAHISTSFPFSPLETSQYSFLNEIDFSADDKILLFGNMNGLQAVENQPKGR
jgi:hypothetical protein